MITSRYTVIVLSTLTLLISSGETAFSSFDYRSEARQIPESNSQTSTATQGHLENLNAIATYSNNYSLEQIDSHADYSNNYATTYDDFQQSYNSTSDFIHESYSSSYTSSSYNSYNYSHQNTYDNYYTSYPNDYNYSYDSSYYDSYDSYTTYTYTDSSTSYDYYYTSYSYDSTAQYTDPSFFVGNYNDFYIPDNLDTPTPDVSVNHPGIESLIAEDIGGPYNFEDAAIQEILSNPDMLDNGIIFIYEGQYYIYDWYDSLFLSDTWNDYEQVAEYLDYLEDNSIIDIINEELAQILAIIELWGLTPHEATDAHILDAMSDSSEYLVFEFNGHHYALPLNDNNLDATAAVGVLQGLSMHTNTLIEIHNQEDLLQEHFNGHEINLELASEQQSEILGIIEDATAYNSNTYPLEELIDHPRLGSDRYLLFTVGGVDGVTYAYHIDYPPIDYNSLDDDRNPLDDPNVALLVGIATGTIPNHTDIHIEIHNMDAILGEDWENDFL